jgi:hypothetical protein
MWAQHFGFSPTQLGIHLLAKASESHSKASDRDVSGVRGLKCCSFGWTKDLNIPRGCDLWIEDEKTLCTAHFVHKYGNPDQRLGAFQVRGGLTVLHSSPKKYIPPPIL